jgi:pimeloyl-ACP methyl ester carboxylesterase
MDARVNHSQDAGTFSSPENTFIHVSAGDMTVAYFSVGSGEPVVLLHCTGGSNKQWLPLAEILRTRFEVIAPDLCGYGETSHWPGAGPFSLLSEVALVTALIDRAGKPVHLVGHSYGGAVALQVARRSPECLTSLTLIEPAAFHLLLDGDHADDRACEEIMDVGAAIARAVNCGDYLKAVRRFVDYWSGEGAWAALPPVRRAALAARIRKITLDFWATFNEPTRLEDFAGLSIPALVLCGECSPLPTRLICSHLARTLPHAELCSISGAGHMLPVTHAADVHPLIMAHIEVAAPPSRRERNPSLLSVAECG